MGMALGVFELLLDAMSVEKVTKKANAKLTDGNRAEDLRKVIMVSCETHQSQGSVSRIRILYLTWW